MLAEKRINNNVLTRVIMGVVFAMLLVGAYLALPTLTQAQTADESANTLKIMPVRTDLEIKPGDSKVVQTTVSNLTDAPISLRPVANDFVAGDEWGTPALILEEDEYAPTHSLKRFMSPLSDIVVEPKQSKTVEVTITVPEDAQAGGYFGAVRFAPKTPEEGGQVNLSASAASLILLKVPGALNESVVMTNFDVTQDGKAGSFFNTANDIKAAVRFENKGNVQLDPIGKISVKQGDKVVYEADFNNKDPRDMILPDSARRWEIPLNKIGSFGKYTVLATFTYGSSNQTIEVSKSFWVVPTGVIIATIAIIVLIIGLVVGARVFLGNYKKRILRKHEDNQQSE